MTKENIRELCQNQYHDHQHHDDDHRHHSYHLLLQILLDWQQSPLLAAEPRLIHRCTARLHYSANFLFQMYCATMTVQAE